MEVSQDQKSEIEKLIAGMKCSKDFECYKSGFTKLCQAVDYVERDLRIECLEEKPQECEFSVVFEQGYYCQYPLRVYAAKKLGLH